MTFVFQDSTEMPTQKNFIADMNNFLALIEIILPIENKAIELNGQMKKERDRYSQATEMMEKFITELNESIEKLSSQYEMEPIEKCKDTIKESSTSCIEKHKEQLKISLDDLTRRSKEELALLGEQIRVELEPFLWSGVYNAKKTQLITTNTENAQGSIKVNINGFSYIYETTYADFPLQIKKYINEISIPIWSKKGLLHKEDRIKHLDFSDYIIKKIYISEDFHLDLENKKGVKKITMKIPKNVKEANMKFIDDEALTITANEHLASQVDFDKIEKLIQSIKEYIENEKHIVSKKLISMEIDEKDAIVNNEIFDCIKIIASQYGEVIKEIFSHGFTTEEIVIKEIIEDGTRNEIFVSVNELSNRLSALGGDGLELKDLLNL
jgi:sulfur relay (sulfurtransferase) DsrF/TusC family protein